VRPTLFRESYSVKGKGQSNRVKLVEEPHAWYRAKQTYGDYQVEVCSLVRTQMWSGCSRLTWLHETVVPPAFRFHLQCRLVSTMRNVETRSLCSLSRQTVRHAVGEGGLRGRRKRMHCCNGGDTRVSGIRKDADFGLVLWHVKAE
jgi:hypothetical protein